MFTKWVNSSVPFFMRYKYGTEVIMFILAYRSFSLLFNSLLLQGRERFLQCRMPKDTNEDWQCSEEPSVLKWFELYCSHTPDHTCLSNSFGTMSILRKEIDTMYNLSDSWFSTRFATWKITRARPKWEVFHSFFSWLATWESCMEQSTKTKVWYYLSNPMQKGTILILEIIMK